MMRLFDEGVVGLKMLKQSGRKRRNSKEYLRAHREVGSVNQRAIVFGNDVLNSREFGQPSGRADDQWHTGKSTGLGIFRHGGRGGKIDSHVATAERPSQFFDGVRRVIDINRGGNLVPLCGGKFANQAAHCSITNESDLHNLFTRSAYKSTARSKSDFLTFSPAVCASRIDPGPIKIARPQFDRYGMSVVNRASIVSNPSTVNNRRGS